MSEKNVHFDFESNYPWIKKDFFQKILENEFSIKTGVVVQNYTLKHALSSGENYASLMIRCFLTYINKNQSEYEEKINFVIKVPVPVKELREIFDEMKLFEKEIIIYEQVLPAVNNLLASIGDYVKFAPKCYHASVKEQFIVMEDLVANGYRNTDRKHGFDLNHYTKVLTKVAKWHAATAVLETMNVSFMSEFREPFIKETSVTYKNVVQNVIKTLAKMTEHQSEYKRIHENLKKLSQTIFSKVCNAVKYDRNEFNGLLHGDLWGNNLMFFYDKHSGKPTDAVLVDYQIGYWGPVSCDLAYTLFTSSNEDLNDFDWDILIQHYHNVLSDTLTKLNYCKPIPCLIDIHVQFLQRAISNAAQGVLLIGLRKEQIGSDESFAKFASDSDEHQAYRAELLSNPLMKRNLDFLLSFFDRKGIFN